MILPDSTILLDYMQHLALRVVRGLVVHADRMRANLDLTHGALFSQRVLLALVARGMQRDEAYRIVQEDAQRAWDTRHAAARAARRARPRPRPRRRSSTSRTTRATRARSSARLDAIAPAGAAVARLTRRRARESVRAMYDYVIVGAGLGGLRARQPAERGPRRAGPAARGRAAGHGGLHPHPGGVHARSSARSTTGTSGPATSPGLDDRRDLPAARQDARRLVVAQRDDLHPRQPGRLRRVARRAAGWGWDDLLPYFLRAEDNERGASEYHGAGGPLRVSDSLARTGLSQAFLDAAAARGLPASEDFNGAAAGRLRLVPADQARRPARRAPRSPTCTRSWTART